MVPTGPPVAVFTEAGKRRVFASALDWPGWARRDRTEELALAALADYQPRYAAIAMLAGLQPPDGPLVVTQRHPGHAKNADFGALGEIAPGEDEALTAAEGARLAALLEAAWMAFDQTAAAAPAELTKGPRGGGRDTAAIVEHVAGAELMYARKAGLTAGKQTRSSPASLSDEASLVRGQIAAGLRDPAAVAVPDRGWPPRYAARRLGWHVLDHLWEIEDKS